MPRLVYFNAFDKQVADHLLEQTRIAVYRKAARDHAQGKPLCLRVIGELIPQPVKQIVDRETDHFGVDGAGLDLVDVEQRVQHARHGAQRLVEPCDQLLCSLPLDGLRQQPLKQGKRLQRLAEVMARGGEKARFRDSGQFRLPLGRLQRVCRVPPLGDVGKGDDDAFDPVVLGAVWQDAADVPGAALRFDLSLDRREGPQHRSGIGQQSAID